MAATRHLVPHELRQSRAFDAIEMLARQADGFAYVSYCADAGAAALPIFSRVEAGLRLPHLLQRMGLMPRNV